MRYSCKCEYCGGNASDIICEACNSELIRKEHREKTAADAAWAAKYKCQSCGKGLPRTRRFNCEHCHTDMNTGIDASWVYPEIADHGTTRLVANAMRKMLHGKS